jgi:class 3 adenylate cyclase
LLINAPRSKNAEVFIIDSNALIWATTRPQAYWTSEVQPLDANLFGPWPLGCTPSFWLAPFVWPWRLGCLMNTSQYPYAPLNAISFADVTTNTSFFSEVEIDYNGVSNASFRGLFPGAASSSGKVRYFVSSRRLRTNFGLNLNVIAFIPDSDLLLDKVTSQIGLAVGLAVLVFFVAITIALGILHLVTKRLEEVQRKMIRAALLQDLDPEDHLNHNDDKDQTADAENDNNNNNDVDDDEDDEGANDVARFIGLHASDSGMNANNQQQQHDRHSNRAENDDDDGDKDANNNNNKRKKYQKKAKEEKKKKEKDDDDAEDRSWISEIANLEEAYAETVRNMTSFCRYVSRAVVSELISQRRLELDNVKDSEQKKKFFPAQKNAAALEIPSSANEDVTVLFAEIEGFSEIWKTHPENHAGVCYILHVYFKRQTRLIMGHGGVVDKFIADSIMCYWGAPTRTEHHALLAVLCSLALLRETRRDPLKKIFQQTVGKDLELRCGVSSGTAFVGSFGSEEALNYSVVGSPVILSKNLQMFNKFWRTSILCDEKCQRKVADVITVRLLCYAALSGDSTTPNHVYEVMGLDSDSRFVRSRLAATFLKSSVSYPNFSSSINNAATTTTTTATTTTTIKTASVSSSDVIPKILAKSTGASALDDDIDGFAMNQPGRPPQFPSASSVDSFSNEGSSSITSRRNYDNATNDIYDLALVANSLHTYEDIDADNKTIAFTDILSVATLEMSGIQELLRDRSSLNNLLRWHVTRTKTSSPAIARFAERFSDAARECIDCRFKECLVILQEIYTDKSYPDDFKKARPMRLLQQIATRYSNSAPKAVHLHNGCFIISNSLFKESRR